MLNSNKYSGLLLLLLLSVLEVKSYSVQDNRRELGFGFPADEDILSSSVFNFFFSIFFLSISIILHRIFKFRWSSQNVEISVLVMFFGSHRQLMNLSQKCTIFCTLENLK